MEYTHWVWRGGPSIILCVWCGGGGGDYFTGPKKSVSGSMFQMKKHFRRLHKTMQW